MVREPKSHRSAFPGIGSILTLAGWRWRQHWFLLLVISLGMVAAITIVCTVPLLSDVMQTASLRNALSSSSTGSELAVHVTSYNLTTPNVASIAQGVDAPFKQYLGPYLKGSPQFVAQTPQFNFLQPALTFYQHQMSIETASMQALASHVTLEAGRLPVPGGKDIEVALTPETAQLLGVKIGQAIQLQIYYSVVPNTAYTQPSLISDALHLRVVGLFHVKPSDPFWHQHDFLPEVFQIGLSQITYYTALTSDQTLLSALDTLSAKQQGSGIFFSGLSHLYWYYHLDPSRISIGQLDTIINQINALQAYVANTYNNAQLASEGATAVIQRVDLFGPALHTPTQPGSLEQLRSQLVVARIPVTILSWLIIGLLLFFVSVMVGILVDRQANAIAVLLSRGARGVQVFASLVTQCLGISLVALLAGPLLALAILPLIVQRWLGSNDQGALSTVTHAPLQALVSVRNYALITVLVAILVMGVAIIGTLRLKMIATTSETERVARHPLWRRLNLDLLAALIALVGYGISIYLSKLQGQFDIQTQGLVVVPLQLIAPLFLVLAAILLILRFFPWLLQLAASLAMRGRGATSVLALAQISRAPRKSLRMILLLALTIAFAIFTLVFNASQTQRAQDISSYAVGADFSGTIPSYVRTYPLPQENALFQRIPGVMAASTGYEEVDASTAPGSPGIPILVRAVDPGSYAQTTIWSDQDSTQSLPSLLGQLASLRNTGTNHDYIPAIVDTVTWNRLGLHIGSSFSLFSNNPYNDNALSSNIHYVAIAQVAHLPGVNDSGEGGVLVDYQNFVAIQARDGEVDITLNHAWMRTSDDPAQLSNIRATLTNSGLYLQNLSDRRAFADTLLNDPLYFNLIGMLAIGATTALLLALLGNLLASWLSVRTRLTSFVVLRALGTSTREISGVLLWEQGIVYATALLLGAAFGAFLALTVVPPLVFADVPTGGLSLNGVALDFLTLQQIIPIQLVAPLSLGIALLVFIATCLVALIMMVRLVVQRSIGRELRLYDDGGIEFATREDVRLPRRRGKPAKVRHTARPATFSMLTVTLWRLRRAKLLTALSGLAIIIAVTIMCLVPLFSSVAMNGGLHSILRAAPTSAQLTLDTSARGLSTQIVEAVQQQISSFFQKDVGSYLNPSVSFTTQTTDLQLVSPGNPTFSSSASTVNVIGASMEQAASHLTLEQGRLPLDTALEALLTPDTARSLHVTVGSIVTVSANVYARTPTYPIYQTITLKIHVVGLMNVAADDAFWHAKTFQPVTQDTQAFIYSLLVPNDALLAIFDQAARSLHTDALLSFQPFELTWDYHLNVSALTADTLDTLIGRLNRLQIDIANGYSNVENADQIEGSYKFPYLTRVSVFNPVMGSFDITNMLSRYRSRLDVVNIPIFFLSILIIGLILFFVSLIAGLMVDQQVDTIAVLRSRGASSGQIFGSMVIQSMSLGLIALILGPLLALLAVTFIASHILQTTGQDAITSMTNHPWDVLLSVDWYALATVLVAVLTLILVLRRAAGMDILAFRRETARTSHRPFWLRLRLDVIAIILAFTGYTISLYLGSTERLLDTRAAVLISSPLTLITPLFLALGCILLLLRLYPPLLRLGARLTARGRSVISMLAFAQMARAPRLTVRMTLLLALTTTFAIFSLIFTASQSERSSDIAAFESGADFTGDITAPTNQMFMAKETALYAHLPGVISATVGYTGEGTISNPSGTLSLELEAVDAATFAHTAIWTTQDSSQSLDSLMAQLMNQRLNGLRYNAVPVIIDASTSDRLHLHVGSLFSLSLNNLPDYENNLVNSQMTFDVIAEVQHIPTVNEGVAMESGGQTSSVDGGMLIDFTSFAILYRQDASKSESPGVPATPVHRIRAQRVRTAGTISEANLPINHVWLRTQDDSAMLGQVRGMLETPRFHLDHLYDRRALLDALRTEPLYLDLITLLTIGAITTLVLALIGYLLVTWVSVRLRSNNFAVLRALGADPRQVVALLVVEQGIVYAVALLLGILFGVVLSVTVVPAIIFSDIPITGVLSNLSDSQFYIIQHTIPQQIVVPPTLSIAFALLVAICVIALSLMVWMVLRPSMSQSLRVNED